MDISVSSREQQLIECDMIRVTSGASRTILWMSSKKNTICTESATGEAQQVARVENPAARWEFTLRKPRHCNPVLVAEKQRPLTV